MRNHILMFCLMTTTATAVATAQTSVFINEFLAKNNSGIKDEQGQFEDWVELYNSASAAVDIGGMYLTDDSTKPTKWAIPTGTKIPAKGTVLIWCDEDATDGPLHANFKLAAEGELIILYASDGKTKVDEIKFGVQATDVSTGRLFDGGQPFVTFTTPTPKADNAPAMCGIRSFDQLLPGQHRLQLAATGTAKIGSALALQLDKAAAQKPALLFAATAATHTPLAGTTIVVLVAPPFFGPFAMQADSSGSAKLTINIPNSSALIGMKVYGQIASEDATGLTATNALEVTICQ